MSAIPTVGAVLMIALTHVLAGMLPVTFNGDSHLALWIMSMLVGIFTYVVLQNEMSRARV
jgi:hypothetical protein